MANNLNQLARAANSGSLPVIPDTEAPLCAACQDISAIKKTLMRGPGIHA
ncbi:MAG: plasmid mobilization relaxosome protein MobC [Acidimicrobiales bacterium]